MDEVLGHELIARYQGRFDELRGLRIRLKDLRLHPRLFKVSNILDRWDRVTGTEEG